MRYFIAISGFLMLGYLFFAKQKEVNQPVSLPLLPQDDYLKASVEAFVNQEFDLAKRYAQIARKKHSEVHRKEANDLIVEIERMEACRDGLASCENSTASATVK